MVWSERLLIAAVSFFAVLQYHDAGQRGGNERATTMGSHLPARTAVAHTPGISRAA